MAQGVKCLQPSLTTGVGSCEQHRRRKTNSDKSFFDFHSCAITHTHAHTHVFPPSVRKTLRGFFREKAGFYYIWSVSYLFTFGYTKIRRVRDPLGVVVSSVVVRWETEERRNQAPLAPLPAFSHRALSFQTSARQLSVKHAGSVMSGSLKGRRVLKDLCRKQCLPDHRLEASEQLF